MRRYLVLLIVPAVFALDWYTKLLVVESLTFQGAVSVTSFFSIVHARNYGGAFSFLSNFEGARYIFTFLPIAISAGLLYVIIAYRFPPAKMVSLVLILSGATGNIYDRLTLGYVIDFLDIYYGSYHWPAFNVADISISTGICLWLFVELMDSLRKPTA